MLIRGLLQAVVLPWCFCGSAFSQVDGLEVLAEKSRVAMEREDWVQALEGHEQMVRRFGRNQPYESYGAQFGTIFYRKGICEMKLKRWSAAMASFEVCYRDFPNRGADQGNPYHKLSLLKWGEAAMGAEQWELARSLFSKFLDERDQADAPFPKGAFYVNVAICEYQLGNMVSGNENLEIAIHNKANFPTPESGIVAAFQALVGAAVDKKNEQALVDFIGKNRGELTMDQDGPSPYAAVFLKLAGDALSSGMERAACLIYQLVPLMEGDPGSGVRLAAIALIHEKNGNIRGAFAAYQQLEWYGRKEVKREDYLYHLVRTAALVGENDRAGFYARRLLKDFPASRYRGELEELGGGDAATDEWSNIEDAVGSITLVPARSQDFLRALDLYQGRRYQEAKEAFVRIKNSSSAQPEGALAGFYEIECLRRMGNLEAMVQALGAFGIGESLGPIQRRQLEINSLWLAAHRRDWAGLLGMTESFRLRRLLDSQRAQVAYLEGLALGNLERTPEALNAFNIAMTADAGASEKIVRQAAVQVMSLCLADSIAQSQDSGKDPGDVEPPQFREAAAIASLFEKSLGAGSPLPESFQRLLKSAEGKK